MNTQMTCEEFYDMDTNQHHSVWQDAMDEMYWNDDFDSQTLFVMLEKRAKKQGVLLLDRETFDYHSFFSEVYDATEKGLS
jgi:hypothetical protein